MLSPSTISTSDEQISHVFSFLLNVKKNYHELINFVDVIYGAFLSFLLYNIGIACSKIGTIYFKDIDINLFSIVCMSFILLFAIEDYRGMRIITSICGYYLSTFRFFVDVLIVLNLFIATLFLNVGKEKALPDNRFILSFAAVYFLCSGWAVLLTKNKREIPFYYTAFIISSHLFVGCVWSAVYILSSTKVPLLSLISLEFPSKSCIAVVIIIFLIYYILVGIFIHSLKRRGFPADDMIEMFVIKLIRGFYLWGREFGKTLWYASQTGRFNWDMKIFYDPPADVEHLDILAIGPGDQRRQMTISEFLNTMAIHEGMPLSINITDLDAATQEGSIGKLEITPLSAFKDEITFFLIKRP